MGLDCYGRAYKKDNLEDSEDFWYARKNRWIQNWMEAKWRELENPNENKEFNCINFYLNKELLKELKEAVEDNSIEKFDKEGFFFGSWEMDEDDKNAILQFVTKAEELLEQDNLVSYYSWW